MNIINKDNYFDKSFCIKFKYNFLFINRNFIYYEFFINYEGYIILKINNNEITLCDKNDKILHDAFQITICDDTYKFENISFKEFQMILEYFLKTINGIKTDPITHDLIQKYKV